MGLLDKFSGILGGKKSAATETVKGPSRVLRDNGIDPSDLKFSFGQDGSLAVSGQAPNQPECDRICEVLKGMPNVQSVQNNISIAVPQPEPVPVPEAVVVEEPFASAEEVSGRSYTVQSGDTLWKIAETMYGSGNKYMKIYEANTSLLESPDRIFPGQELVIPDLEE